jgi:hypothetical protein
LFIVIIIMKKMSVRLLGTIILELQGSRNQIRTTPLESSHGGAAGVGFVDVCMFCASSMEFVMFCMFGASSVDFGICCTFGASNMELVFA